MSAKDYFFKACGATDTGLTRQDNEDSYYLSSSKGIFIVADGLGGEAAGEVASNLAVYLITESLKQARLSAMTELKELIEAAVRQAHEALIARAREDVSLRGMATTVVLAVAGADNVVFLANVGDSRAYLYRNKQLLLLSQDHSLVGELVRKGKITPEGARVHPERNIITQALGFEQIREIYHAKVELKNNDLILLCSDGLWEMLLDEEIAYIIGAHRGDDICKELVRAANLAGGRDNITVIAMEKK